MKVTFKIIQKEDRIFFNDGTQYVLLDSGFLDPRHVGRYSAAVNGMIGPFKVRTESKMFFENFINLQMDETRSVAAVFNPMDGFNCTLCGDMLTITDEEMKLDEYEHFFPFVKPQMPFLPSWLLPDLPMIEGRINGKKRTMLFDSGARMTMVTDPQLLKGEKVRSYTEWMGMIREYAELPVFNVELQFGDDFKYSGESALVTQSTYTVQAQHSNIFVVLGIDMFKLYDMAIVCKGSEKGIALLAR